MSNCSEHKKDLFGQTDMKLVAEAIVKLHYESLAELFYHLPHAFMEGSDKDYSESNNKLGHNQGMIAHHLNNARPYAEKLWLISKPFMESNKTIKT